MNIDTFLTIAVACFGVIAVRIQYLQWRAVTRSYERSMRYLSQIEALNTFAIELIRELYDAENQIGTEWTGADEDVTPNLKDRLRRLGDIIGIDSEDLEKQVWEGR